MKKTIKKVLRTIKNSIPVSVRRPIVICCQNWMLAYQISRIEGNEKLFDVLRELNENAQKRNIEFSSVYDYGFYVYNRYHSAISALHILPTIFTAVPHDSIIDFGCGTGTWLWVAQKLGAKEITGLDGEYVPKSLLMIPESSFHAVNLQKPVGLPKKYDLAISMEVGEHLPETSADSFVDSISASSDVVLFSAAHPGQGGDDHINEQPIEYWIEKFRKKDYLPIEIKKLFSEDQQICSWYRQNIILFVKSPRFNEIIKKIGV